MKNQCSIPLSLLFSTYYIIFKTKHTENQTKQKTHSSGTFLGPPVKGPSKTKLYNCHPDGKGQDRSHGGSFIVHLDAVSSLSLRSALSAGFSIRNLSLHPKIPPHSFQLDSSSSFKNKLIIILRQYGDISFASGS